jgi:Domain of unknown function (DUF4375)
VINIINSVVKFIRTLFSSKTHSADSKTVISNNKKANIELLLASPDSNNSIIKLDNYISEKCEWGHSLAELSPPEKTFYLNQALEREVNNGGFWQYFRNSSGNLAHETVQSLNDINAFKTSKILASAIEYFPDKKVPVDRDLRNTVIDDIEADAKEQWNKFDQQFFKYEDNLHELNIEFVRKNIQHF